MNGNILQLGVEWEVEISRNDEAPVEYDTKYPVVWAWNKGETSGNRHDTHGNYVEAISKATDDFIKVGYDSTASTKEGWGLEMIGDPGSIDQNKEAWRPVFDILSDKINVNPTGQTQYHNPVSCGMHVHVSGGLKVEEIARIAKFIFDFRNRELIKGIAGRYDTHYCKIPTPFDPAQVAALFHADDCTQAPGMLLRDAPIDRGRYTPGAAAAMEIKRRGLDSRNCRILGHVVEVYDRPLLAAVSYNVYVSINGDESTTTTTSGATTTTTSGVNLPPILPQLLDRFIVKSGQCCEMADSKYDSVRNRIGKRLALNMQPTKGTGEIEFRLFASPDCIDVMNSRLEFTHACVTYCRSPKSALVSLGFISWVVENSREYPNLNETLVSLGLVNPLVLEISKVLGYKEFEADRAINAVVLSA